MKTKNGIAGAAVTILLFAFLFVAFDMLYCLNDDMMIQSILSGTFSGKTSGMSVYLSMPLSTVLALLYGIVPQIPWLGVFFALCYALCFFLVLYRNYEEAESVAQRILMTFFQILVFFAIFFAGYLLPHYTVVAALVGGCGIFLLITGASDNKGKNIKNYMPGIFLLWLCYLIRTKVFLLLLPFLAIAGLVMLLHREKKERIDFLKKLALPVALFALGILLFFGINYAAYYLGDWAAYTGYNDARTTLYDYVGIDTTEEMMDNYEAAGFSQEEVRMYKSYNLLLEESNSHEAMEALASCKEAEKESVSARLYNALVTYKARALHQQEDMPYQYLALGLYGIILLYVVLTKQYRMCLPVILCGMARSLCWVYLIYAGRYPQRVTMSIFIMETFLLLAIWKVAAHKRNGKQMVHTALCAIAVLLFSWAAVYSVKDSLLQYENQIAVNESEGILYSYMQEREDAFFLVDVYATVNYTEYAVREYDSAYENYLVLGGWLTESPLLFRKLQKEGYTSALQALREGENVYLVLKEGVSMTPEMLYERYPEEISRLVAVEHLTTEHGEFVIYQIATEE